MIEQSKKIQEAHDIQMLENRGKTLTPRQVELLQTIERFPDIGNKDLTILMGGITMSTLKEHIYCLQTRGLITFKSGFRGLKSYRISKKTSKRKIKTN
jgi:DNA-binding MarR family transcriptional regulator